MSEIKEKPVVYIILKMIGILNRSKQYLPPGHAGRVGQQQQSMGQMQPGPMEISNMYNILSALGNSMGSPNR